MGREAKVGIVLIGILLAVFGALLYKRMARPSKVKVGELAVNSNQATDPSKRKLQQPAAPTLITPRTGSRPQDNRYANQSGSARNSKQAKPDRIYINGQPVDPPSASERYGQNWRNDADTAGQRYQSGYGSVADPYSQGRYDRNSGDRYGAAAIVGGMGSRWTTDGSQDSSYSYQRGDQGGQRYSTTGQPDPFQRVTPYQSSTSVSVPDTSYRDTARQGARTTADRRSNSSDSRGLYYVNGQPQYDYSQYDSRSHGRNQAPVDQTPPIQLDGDQYAVQPNDSYWSVCEKAYGNGAFFKALYHHNKKRRDTADELTVGQTISVPDENVLRRKYPDLCPRPNQRVASSQQRFASASGRMRGTGRTYTVIEGDTLFEIARYELGKAARWGEIYELNRDVLGEDFDYLRPGLELALPDDGRRRETVTRQPEPIFPR